MEDPLTLLVALLVSYSILLFFIIVFICLFFRSVLMLPSNLNRLSSVCLLLLVLLSLLTAILVFSSPASALAFEHDTRAIDDAIEALSDYSDQEIYLNNVATVYDHGPIVIYTVKQIFDRTKLTIFAPQLEGDVRDFLPDFTQYRSFLCGHVVPCKLTLRDLQYYAKTNTLLPTFFEGYTIHITRSARNKLLIALKLRRSRPDPLSDSEVCSVAQTTLRPGSTGFFGPPRDICVDWRTVDMIMFQESVWKKVRYSCTAQFADYHLATDAFKAIGDSFMSAFLDMQLIDTARQLKPTVLAPVNEHDRPYWLNYIVHYRQHLIPCRVTWSDLLILEEGTLLSMLAKNPLFKVIVTKLNGAVLLNDVPVVYPGLYSSDTNVIHGIASKIQFKECDF